MAKRPKWTKQDDEVLRAAVAKGLSLRQIEVGARSEKSIQSRMSQLGLNTSFCHKDPDTYAIRRCLKCAQSFGSHHVGNRICSGCKEP